MQYSHAGGLMISALAPDRLFGFEPLPGTLCCVFGQDT